ncbi:dicarboxylate/amino acid:cation symporter [Pseudomonas sp. NPDC090592]|uniref:dicarboxylate/amino acid:cation symporter n=1 Tax=Pseudomonas sp. NPDC090592 TaxID=3364480 RepID=UPI00383AD21F
MNHKKLPRLIALAIVVGVIVGWASHNYAVDESTAKEIASYYGLISEVFLRLIKMIIGPLVFATLVCGIASMGQSSAVSSIGFRAMAWFVTASFVSLLVGLMLVNLFQPGAGLNMDLHQSASAPVAVNAGSFNLASFITHVFPRSFVEAMANNEILQIVVFSIFFGSALCVMKGKGTSVIFYALEELSKIMFKITDYVMMFAPLGVFAAIASAITVSGLGLLVDYGWLILQFYLGLGILWMILFGVGFLFLGRSIFTLGKLIREPLMLAFSTSSSETAFPKTMEALEKFGANKRASSFILPLGYSFNLDGSMMYQAFAVIFIAQAFNVELSFTQQLLMLLTLMLTSKGVAGVARASVVVVAATLPMFNLPESGILLVLAIDQFFDMGRAATNVVGNSIATAVIAKTSERDGVLDAGYSGKIEPKATESASA